MAPAQVVVADGSCTLGREDIGGKAWGVNRMRALGLPVPSAIVITTQACREYYANSHALDERLWAQVVERMRVLEENSGRRFGGVPRPLLVSVRSGAMHSMPGMMDTVLDLGINDEVEAALAVEYGRPAYAADTHRRFLAQYRKVVLGGAAERVPDDPWAQLRGAITAVFESWRSPRAQIYRRDRGLSDAAGTAVMIQAMVFGNADEHSGTGVLFSRNPMTGDPPAWGEWLRGGQGEDVVSGQYTPAPLSALRDEMPDVHAELMRATAILEADATDIQDIEFTVQSRHLWLLQSRVAKRSPQAALRTAVAFAEEGLITREAAVRRVRAEQVRQLPRLRLAAQSGSRPPSALGEPASPGVARGIVVTDPHEAETRGQLGEDVILARPNTSPEDLPGIIAARGVATEQGGSTSHAAVICRELGRPCVVGCGSGSVVPMAGKLVTLDGASGRVWTGDVAVDQSDETASEDTRKLLEWGLPLVPLRLLRRTDATDAAIDLDRHGEAWREALAPGIAVRGRVLDTDEGIQAALVAGVGAAIVSDRLPALLACLRVESDRHRPAHEASAPSPVARTVPEIALLRLIGLKGRATAALLGDALATSAQAAGAQYERLCERGLCGKMGPQFHLSAAGRDHLNVLLAEERKQADHAAIIALYEDFCALDGELKQLMTAWQVKPDGALNDHQDAGYDRARLDALSRLHARVVPFLRRLAGMVPRMTDYAARLGRAAARIAAGEHAYVAKLTADSYHMIWFELHEELIALAGLTREALARNRASAARKLA